MSENGATKETLTAALESLAAAIDRLPDAEDRREIVRLRTQLGRASNEVLRLTTAVAHAEEAGYARGRNAADSTEGAVMEALGYTGSGGPVAWAQRIVAGREAVEHWQSMPESYRHDVISILEHQRGVAEGHVVGHRERGEIGAAMRSRTLSAVIEAAIAVLQMPPSDRSAT